MTATARLLEERSGWDEFVRGGGGGGQTAGGGRLPRVLTPADLLACLEHQAGQPSLRQVGRGDQAVMAGAGDHNVEGLAHAAPSLPPLPSPLATVIAPPR